MLGQSVLPTWKGCMGSQAVWHSPSEKLDSCFQVLSSSYRCPLHHCPSWKCLASLLLSLRQWLLPRSDGFSRFHTSYCLMWNPAPLEGGSHGTFSKTNKITKSSWQRHSRYDFTWSVKKMYYSSCPLLAGTPSPFLYHGWSCMVLPQLSSTRLFSIRQKLRIVPDTWKVPSELRWYKRLMWKQTAEKCH